MNKAGGGGSSGNRLNGVRDREAADAAALVDDVMLDGQGDGIH